MEKQDLMEATKNASAVKDNLNFNEKKTELTWKGNWPIKQDLLQLIKKQENIKL